MRTLKGALSSKDIIIAGFEKKFEELRTQLDRAINVNTQLQLFRVMDQIKDIGM